VSRPSIDATSDTNKRWSYLKSLFVGMLVASITSVTFAEGGSQERRDIARHGVFTFCRSIMKMFRGFQTLSGDARQISYSRAMEVL